MPSVTASIVFGSLELSIYSKPNNATSNAAFATEATTTANTSLLTEFNVLSLLLATKPTTTHSVPKIQISSSIQTLIPSVTMR